MYETEVKLQGCKNTFRQIAINDHGRPKFVEDKDMVRNIAIESIHNHSAYAMIEKNM